MGGQSIREGPGVEAGVHRVLSVAIVVEKVVIDAGRQRALARRDAATAAWRLG